MYRTTPRETDCTQTISESCQLYLHGQLKAIYIQDWTEAEELRPHILAIKRWDHGTRLSGVPTLSRTFGYTPRRPMQGGRDYCSKAALAREQPPVYEALCRMAAKIEGLVKEYGGDRFDRQQKEVHARVPRDYIIPNSNFTSGIVNRNNPLQYHYDAGNFEGFFSAMIAFKKNTGGGHLNLPEYDVKLDIGDRSVLLFDGQDELHGVTPITRDSIGYRFTVVFYTLEQLWKCLPHKEEIRRAQINRTKTEMKRAGITK